MFGPACALCLWKLLKRVLEKKQRNGSETGKSMGTIVYSVFVSIAVCRFFAPRGGFFFQQFFRAFNREL